MTDKKRRLLVFFSDTGGGHRAAANALCDGFEFAFPGKYEIRMVDGFLESAPFPFNRIPATYYPITTYTPWLWGMAFHLSNSRPLEAAAASFDDVVLRRGMKRLLESFDPDLVISVHPLLNRAPRAAFKRFKPDAPFVTVVTDLFDAHGLWFSACADLCIVPTEGAYQRGLEWKFPREHLRIIGQPIALKFAAPPTNETVDALRTRLGIETNIFTVLIVGGGEGMGAMGAIAEALDESELPIQLVIVTGRNKKLQDELNERDWQIPVSVQGFVTNMPDWLRASDLVITKAGPGTIMEAATAGKPIILSGFLPGQEEGNVTFVEKTGVGVLCATPEAIVKQLRTWLQPGNHALETMRTNAKHAARPEAAIEIAKAIDGLL